MKKLEQHLFNATSSSFFIIFTILFSITSVIHLVKIAAYTSVIKISFFELFLFYSYAMPNILFYTSAISMFIALVLTFSKISKDYELIIFASFGLNPLKNIKIMAFTVFLFSLTVSIVSLALIPKANFLSSELFDAKKKEANFNISPNEFGQKFGKWMIFIEERQGNIFREVKLFSNNNNKDTFIASSTALLSNVNGNLNLSLNNGKAYIANDSKIDQINFQIMSFNDSISDSQIEPFNSLSDYWSKITDNQKRAKDLSIYILISFFPFISLVLILAISVYNPRYESNFAIFYAIVSVILYYLMSYFFATNYGLKALFLIPAWFLLSTVVYNFRISKRY